MKVSVLSPAKINLSLDIIGKRPDGYHDVSMVMQSVSLYDTVTVEDIGVGNEVKISCTKSGVPLDKSNIAYKAYDAFFKYTEAEPHSVSIDIEKNIPFGAGLAGGSTDGAGVILALNKLCSTRLSQKQMCEIASSFGADVPFCIMGGTAHATNTGTDLKKIVSMPKCYIVICKPEISISTKEAYDKCDSRPKKTFIYTDEVIRMLYKRDLRGLCSCLYNEFEEVLQLDEIVNLKKQMLKNKALGCSMTGSGSAVYGIFDSEKKANACMNILKENYNDVFVCKPTDVGCKIE
ncbi:MAG: 4-(cytidine 5'-diphospho)-2-C-methyl-D-erythritol kinase [Oscillospiraceae bacterium]|nr:4-(cytidine 5'-diphospho)-2-C-methyl-D-erythritol kinase [Candidatus Ruminococcus equi]